MAYQVFDNGQSADYSGSCCNMERGLGWDNSKFPTLQEAIIYAIKYLGDYAVGFKPTPIVAQMFLQGYKYTDSGDTLQIKEVK